MSIVWYFIKCQPLLFFFFSPQKLEKINISPSPGPIMRSPGKQWRLQTVAEPSQERVQPRKIGRNGFSYNLNICTLCVSLSLYSDKKPSDLWTEQFCWTASSCYEKWCYISQNVKLVHILIEFIVQRINIEQTRTYPPEIPWNIFHKENDY